MAYSKRVKKELHYIFFDKDEFRKVYPKEKIQDNWREAEEGSWCYSDDNQIVQVLKKGTLKSRSSKRPTIYIKTLLGMKRVSEKSTLGGDPPESIHNFSGKHSKTDYKNKNITSSKRLFAKYVAYGMEITEAYRKAHPKAKSIDYIHSQTKLLLKSTKVKKLIDKEVENLLSESGITHRYLLEQSKEIIDKPDAKDGDKLRSIETLMKISGLLNAEKRTDTMAMIQEFKGFSHDKLMAFEAGARPQELKESNDSDL